jgi:hypothetical protein
MLSAEHVGEHTSSRDQKPHSLKALTASMKAMLSCKPLLTANGGAIQGVLAGQPRADLTICLAVRAALVFFQGLAALEALGGIFGCGFSSSSFGVLNGVPTAPGGYGNGGAGGGSNTSKLPGSGGSAGVVSMQLLRLQMRLVSYAVGSAGANGAAGTNG